jgi:putative Ca2+/H+ antiporter (TMEM165/GDT1 family)
MSARTQEPIAVALGETLGCDCCLASTAAIGGLLRIPTEAEVRSP